MPTSFFPLYGVLLALLVATLWSVVRCVHALHMLQLDSYANARLLRWLWTQPSRRLIEGPLSLVLLGLCGVSLLLWASESGYGVDVVLGVWCVTGGVLFLRRKAPQAKKALIYTPRALRILSLACVLDLAVSGAYGVYAFGQIEPGMTMAELSKTVLLCFLVVFIIIHGAPFAVMLANGMLMPIQAAINARYLAVARRRLRQGAPVVVGITGSYGKTSTKYFLDVLLRERYCPLKTPQSFNTLMGICRVINHDLQPYHDVFIVEMGAYRRGDIRDLADLVEPQIGILTAIGPQHLERFKTMANIEATKYELIASLGPSGIAVLNNDDDRCRVLANRTRQGKVVRYGLDHTQPGLRVWAEGITPNPPGQTFTLVDSDGNRAQTHTGLVGRHNVLNILGAACAALEMGLRLDDIARTIPKIQPAPHRLQLLHGAGGVTVLDDSYNANPLGAAEALNVLRDFTTGKRILVTPGMVELGEIEAEENEKFGARAASVCDYVLLVGPMQTQAILRGLERQCFPPERIRIVQDLAAATAELHHIVQAGDVVLFENDLPDLYVEA
ncbi:UDP-N-acetylmuramoyl-tripeptide--D-alanyl-D-alanine ligase [Candidatus Entotheonellaceae bacterium PAL068K]